MIDDWLNLFFFFSQLFEISLYHLHATLHAKSSIFFESISDSKLGSIIRHWRECWRRSNIERINRLLFIAGVAPLSLKLSKRYFATNIQE